MPDVTTSDTPAEQPTQSASTELRRFDKLLIALLAISLLAHMVTFAGFLGLRMALRNQISELADGVQQAKSTTVRYSFPIDQQVPINMSVPIQNSIDVPIKIDVRINQTLSIPIDTPLGKTNLPIPIDATIPVSTTVPIEIKQNLPISATVPIRMNVPLEIDLGSQEFASYFDRLYQALIDLRERL